MTVPHGLSEIIKVYGNPDADGNKVLDPEWYATQTALFDFPVPFRLAWDVSTTVNKFRAHVLAGHAIADALGEIAWFYREQLQKRNFDLFGGVFNFRYKRGGQGLSTHAWGIAIDLNPHIGRMGSKKDAEEYPRIIVKAFEDRCFEWGGRWSVPDAMHFQLCSGY